MAKVPTALSKRIKELRESENLTQQDFAKEFKISKQTVSNYENNERTPDVTLMLKISNHFNVSMDYLTGNSQYKTQKLKHIKEVTHIELSLIESIGKMPDVQKIFLHNLLVDNSKAFNNFIESLVVYRHSDNERIANAAFKDGPTVFRGVTFTDVRTQALSEGIDLVKIVVEHAFNKLLADITKTKVMSEEKNKS